VSAYTPLLHATRAAWDGPSQLSVAYRYITIKSREEDKEEIDGREEQELAKRRESSEVL
jgi:hypothetical protein